MLKYFTILIFAGLSLSYYFIPFGAEDLSQVFLSISTFLFAIFTGFFIARQGRRYSAIRDRITQFDGEMSSIYRQFGHLSSQSQEEVKKIIKNHYGLILENKAWDYHFVNKSSTLISIHELIERTTKDQKLPTLKNFAVQRILVALQTLQGTRKSMVALHSERIPKFQWVLVYFLAAILLSTVSVIPSHLLLFGAILKAAFGSAVIFVIILLHEFDRLRFFEKTIGEHSAQDILDIFSGKK